MQTGRRSFLPGRGMLKEEDTIDEDFTLHYCCCGYCVHVRLRGDVAHGTTHLEWWSHRRRRRRGSRGSRWWESGGRGRRRRSFGSRRRVYFRLRRIRLKDSAFGKAAMDRPCDLPAFETGRSAGVRFPSLGSTICATVGGGSNGSSIGSVNSTPIAEPAGYNGGWRQLRNPTPPFVRRIRL